jgi:hypothetical protein
VAPGIITTAAAVELSFVMPRPVATPKRRTPPAVKKPDLDKCIRAVFDALTGVVLADGSLVVDVHGARKRLADIGEEPGVVIVVTDDVDPSKLENHLSQRVPGNVSTSRYVLTRFGPPPPGVVADPPTPAPAPTSTHPT